MIQSAKFYCVACVLEANLVLTMFAGIFRAWLQRDDRKTKGYLSIPTPHLWEMVLRISPGGQALPHTA